VDPDLEAKIKVIKGILYTDIQAKRVSEANKFAIRIRNHICNVDPDQLLQCISGYKS
jgi:hypothetical protein